MVTRRRASFFLLGMCLVAGGCTKLIPAKLLSRGPSSSSPWLTDLAQAKAQARTEHKRILVKFTGSDWCAWCKRLHREVFAKASFVQYAQSNLVLVEIDFPRNKPQTDDLRRANQALAERYRVQGFPTLILLDSEGRNLGSTGYRPGGPKTLIAELSNMARQAQISEANSAAAAEATGAAALRLKGISGTVGHRLALINNTTLAAGESANIKVGDGRIAVRCIAILEEAVVLAVDGRTEPIELRLSGRL